MLKERRNSLVPKAKGQNKAMCQYHDTRGMSEWTQAL